MTLEYCEHVHAALLDPVYEPVVTEKHFSYFIDVELGYFPTRSWHPRSPTHPVAQLGDPADSRLGIIASDVVADPKQVSLRSWRPLELQRGEALRLP